MMIEQIFPNAVGTKSTLRDRLIAEARVRGLENSQTNAIVALIPEGLICAPAFLDKMTNIWRYEFGVPHNIKDNLFWGTHMWAPVHCLFNALLCAYSRLLLNTRKTYLERLLDPITHQYTLMEMLPGYKVDSTVPVQFEVSGLGIGNRTVDWVIGPQHGRTILLDVKRRIADFIKQAERMGDEYFAPEPDHDPALLFRSVEQKFKSANPDLQLQGVWIITDIKQDEQRLFAAFTALDASKVHFAILGDWKSDAYIMVRRDEDERYLRDIFHAEKSTRFTFTKNVEGYRMFSKDGKREVYSGRL